MVKESSRNNNLKSCMMLKWPYGRLLEQAVCQVWRLELGTCHNNERHAKQMCQPCSQLCSTKCLYSQMLSNFVRDLTCSSWPLRLTGLRPPRKSADSECMWQLTANNFWFHSEANNWQMVVLPQLQCKHNTPTHYKWGHPIVTYSSIVSLQWYILNLQFTRLLKTQRTSSDKASLQYM